jgi:plasmid stabilization system protein ParE
VSGAAIEFTPEALREIDDAFEWYLERNARAADAFVREVDSAVALIASSPTLWTHFEAGTRQYILRKFPYTLVYREVPTGIEVVAVAHHKRRPRYWIRRLRRK